MLVQLMVLSFPLFYLGMFTHSNSFLVSSAETWVQTPLRIAKRVYTVEAPAI